MITFSYWSTSYLVYAHNSLTYVSGGSKIRIYMTKLASVDVLLDLISVIEGVQAWEIHGDWFQKFFCKQSP